MEGFSSRTTRAARSPDFPDLTMVRRRASHLCRAEESARPPGIHTQDEWLNDLGNVPGMTVFLWRPSHWPDIEWALKP